MYIYIYIHIPCRLQWGAGKLDDAVRVDVFSVDNLHLLLLNLQLLQTGGLKTLIFKDYQIIVGIPKEFHHNP